MKALEKRPQRRYQSMESFVADLESFAEVDENQANEMVAVLATAGVSSSRSADKKGIYALSVDGQDVAGAITILKNAGYPREQFQSLGDVFSADGIIGTPFEQHARFIHAMNQELSQTITSIAGVRSARVFVTAPPKGRYDRTPPRASASVTVHHETDFDASKNLSMIKQIIAYSLTNLDYDDVAVALFPAGGPKIAVVSEASVTPANPQPTDAAIEPAQDGPTQFSFQALPSTGMDLAREHRLALMVFGGIAVLLALFALRERLIPRGWRTS